MSDTAIYWALYVTIGVLVAELYLYALRKYMDRYTRSTICVGYLLVGAGWPVFASAMAACYVVGFVNGIKKAVKK
jgi:hypothetical protein